LIGFRKEATIRYEDGNFEILSPGDFVKCAVTGAQISLNQLRYWSVDRQEAYSTPEAAMKRHKESQS